MNGGLMARIGAARARDAATRMPAQPAGDRRCSAAVSSDCHGELPAHPVFLPALGERRYACDVCQATLIGMGLDVRDERPEWLRRNAARDLTSALLAS
jgi:hypothetical protein